MMFTNFPDNQTVKANYYYISVLEVLHTDILSNGLIQNKKNEYRDVLNLSTYTLSLNNPFSFQHALFSLQIER